MDYSGKGYALVVFADLRESNIREEKTHENKRRDVRLGFKNLKEKIRSKSGWDWCVKSKSSIHTGIWDQNPTCPGQDITN